MSSVLQVENIKVYYGSIHAVKDVSFYVEQGEVVTLIGANGAGKSTALNTVAGLLRSRTGSVHFLGEELRHVPGHKLVGRGTAGERRHPQGVSGRIKRHKKEARLGASFFVRMHIEYHHLLPRQDSYCGFYSYS